MSVCSLSPREPAVPERSLISGKAPPGWTDCWLGRSGPRLWFLAGRRPPGDDRGGAPALLEEEHGVTSGVGYSQC